MRPSLRTFVLTCVTITTFVVFLTLKKELELELVQHKFPLDVSPPSSSSPLQELESSEEVPEVFKTPGLWRKPWKEVSKVGAEDRFLLQEEWIRNISKSEYMKNIKRKVVV